MTASEVKSILGNNREMIINFFYDNVKEDNFYYLGWFMTRVLNESIASWIKRKNIAEKEIMSVMNKVMKSYPQIAKGYISNYEKAVNYFGKEKANQILNAK